MEGDTKGVSDLEIKKSSTVPLPASEIIKDDNGGSGEDGAPPPSETSPEEIPDKYKMLYCTMLIHGIGTLLPWNMFINASSFFVDHKLSYNYTGRNLEYVPYFIQYMGILAQGPAALVNWLNIFVRCERGLSSRIIGSLVVEVICFVITIILAVEDTSKFPDTFFGVILTLVFLINVAGGIFQNSIFGIGAKVDQTSTLLLGTNISGTFVALVNILSIVAAPSLETAAGCYFTAALVVLILCIGSYCALHKMARYTYLIEKSNKQKTDSSEPSQRPPSLDVLKQCWTHCLNLCFIFVITLAVYPAVTANIRMSSDPGFYMPEMYFTAVVGFLNFNVSAVIGNLLFERVRLPARYVWIPVVLRIVFIPFFLYCNYQPVGISRYQLYIFGDWMYCWGVVVLGVTSGYLSSLSMFYCQRSVESEEHIQTAGMFGAASIVTGVLLGLLCSFAMRHFVGCEVQRIS